MKAEDFRRIYELVKANQKPHSMPVCGTLECKEEAGPAASTVKALATFHPAYLLRSPSGPETAIAEFDLRKAAREARVDGIQLPMRNIQTQCSHMELLLKLSLLKEQKPKVWIDIEGGCNGIACIGFATSPQEAFVVPFVTVEGASCWSWAEELELWKAVEAVLEDPEIPKGIMNALYEWFALAWNMGIVIQGVEDDIMLKHFELYCEFDKSLEFQASLYTNQPYWKLSHRKGKDGLYKPFKDGKPITSDEWYRYNGTDCCVTAECDLAQEKLLKPMQRQHYRENMQMLVPILYVMLRGMKYDLEEARKHRKGLEKRIHALQDRINRECAPARPALAGFFEALSKGEEGLVGLLTEAFCQVRRTMKEKVEVVHWQPMKWNGKKWVKAGKRVDETTPDCVCVEALPETGAEKLYLKVSKLLEKPVAQPVNTLQDILHWSKESCLQDAKRACAIVRKAKGHWTPALRGELSLLLGVGLKIRASGRDKDTEDAEGQVVRGDERDANWFLYEFCKLPKQFVKEGNTNTDRLASDEEAVIKAWLASHKERNKRDRRALWFATLKKLMTEARNLKALPDEDGRIRSSFTLPGSKTHRLSNSSSPTGSSNLNLQTITKKHRRFYRADEGYEMCQRDLGGSDGWTVAAYCAMLGDRTMLEDYGAKLKPAQIGVLMWQQGAVVNKLSREELKPLCKAITEETTDWEYFAFKRVQHMSSYKGGTQTMSDQILTDSIKKGGKPVYVDKKTCDNIQKRCFFARYPGIPQWHRWMENQLRVEGSLTSDDGFMRRFYGRKDDNGTLRDALAHLPQYYTTRATMKALMRLWNDPENRNEDGSLKVEPLHTVHDSLLTQWKVEERAWAVGKIKEWFQNPMLIAGMEITIPASGTYGPSWGEQENEI